MSDSNILTLPTFADEIEKVFKNLYVLNKQASSKFVINLDDAWKWIGFATKGSAKRFLQNNAELNQDYIIEEIHSEKGGRAIENILMTTDLFKNICFMTKTDQSKAVRKYFIDLEEKLRNGDLTLAAEVVQNYDNAHNTKTKVTLETIAKDVDPLWYQVWREQRTIQKSSGKALRDVQKEILDKMDVKLYACIENMHNQAIFGFEGTSRQWKKENGIPDRVAVADCMNREQLDLRRMMSIKLIRLFSEIENPTSQSFKNAALKMKEFTKNVSEGFGFNTYEPVMDDETGKLTYIAKKVSKLEQVQKRTQLRLKTLERKQELLEESCKKPRVNNITNNITTRNVDTVNNNN